jgi:Uma2 family endonuclease
MKEEWEETISTQEISPEEFEQMSGEKSFELVDGFLKEKPMGARSSYIARELATQLTIYCRANPCGHPISNDSGFRCFPLRPKLVRKPDVAFVRFGKLPNEVIPNGHIKIAPDLAAEVVSPGDSYEEIEEKVMDYRSAGVELIWIISPLSQRILIRRLDGSADELAPSDELSGENVIPGFRCRVSELFETMKPR